MLMSEEEIDSRASQPASQPEREPHTGRQRVEDSGERAKNKRKIATV